MKMNERWYTEKEICSAERERDRLGLKRRKAQVRGVRKEEVT
jgi:hypothetical protein